MLETVGTNPTLHQRVKLMIVAALLTLSLGLGIATTAQHADVMAGAKSAVSSAVSVASVRYCYKDPGKGMVCVVK